MRRLAASIGITFALGATGFAADIVTPKWKPAAPVAYVAPWSGVYVGAFAGGHWSRDRWSSNRTLPAANIGPIDLKANGFTGGALVGANVQYGNHVWGVETDVGFLTGSVTYPGGDIDSIESKLRWNAHARIRKGYSFGQWMPFVAAGVAYADTKMTIVDPPDTPPVGSLSLNRIGFSSGAGVDWMFAPNWMARAEYLHDRYAPASFSHPLVFDSQHMQLTSHIVRGAVMYKFGDGPAAAGPASYGPAPVFKAPVAYAGSWSGVYLGLFAGGHWSRDRWDSEEIRPASDMGPLDLKVSGFTGGGLVGANLQQGNLVWGTEADIGWLTGTNTFDVTGFAARDFDSIGTKMRWSAHARLRFGYPVGSWMPFVAAGVAYANTRITVIDTANTSLPKSQSISLDRLGFTLGAGIDWMINLNWIARVEYLHDRYAPASFALPVEDESSDMQLRSHIVRGALIYKFGEDGAMRPYGGIYKAPVAATPASWTGVYIGAFAGGHWSHDRWLSHDTRPATLMGPFDLKVNGFTGGALSGANVQHGKGVWGVETDIGWLTGTNTFDVTGFASRDIDSIETKMRWNAHARLRYGYPVGSWMPFVAAGVAYANTRMTLVDPTSLPPRVTSANISLNRVGFTLGAGIDWMINPNWFARVEYLHDRYSTASFQVPVEDDNQHMELRSNIVRGALIYKLDGGPVVAKY